MSAWSYRDSDGRLHAVRWENGQIVGDSQAIALIQMAVDAGWVVDEVGTRANVRDWATAWLTVDRTLRYWFDTVEGPAIDTSLPPGAVR
jgi:hypothetical protein